MLSVLWEREGGAGAGDRACDGSREGAAEEESDSKADAEVVGTRRESVLVRRGRSGCARG